ncbi:helix-turn-helix transcriptional regulator [Proteus mirabilis]|uniref:helix-turn-helix domain-containing protein n=1 Tax=Bacteria TaxID=2 RepID=UPI001A2DA8C9|nr:helix-turn-helix transcriptional regulator [Proteus mirabilis]
MLGERIRKYRTDKGLSLEELANMVGSTKSYIWEIEKKPEIKPSADLISKIASALNVTIDALMNEDTKNDQDVVFFREYSKLSDDTKEQLFNILKAIKPNN